VISMGHPEIINQTPFEFAPLFVADEDGRPIVATVIKATLMVSAQGEVTRAEQQEAISFAGEYYGEPGESSMRREPEVAFVKPGTDCVLQGHATAVRRVTHVDVGFRIGPLQKVARVTGDRRWEPGLVGKRISAPQPFERLPLVYERAFGGWDRTPEKEGDHSFEPQNPVGVGFVAKRGKFVPGAPLPNIEDPKKPLTSHGGHVATVGFGFVGYDWQPRAGFAGTYDEAWERERAPLLPKDFDRRFFQGASPGLTADRPFQGNEPVSVIGATPEGRWDFRLPGIGAPTCEVATHYGPTQALQTVLDTVIVDADARQVLLLWRAHMALRQGPHDVAAITIAADNIPPMAASPPSVAAGSGTTN